MNRMPNQFHIGQTNKKTRQADENSDLTIADSNNLTTVKKASATLVTANRRTSESPQKTVEFVGPKIIPAHLLNPPFFV